MDYKNRDTKLLICIGGITVVFNVLFLICKFPNTTLTAESEEELKSILMKVKVEREKAGLKLNIQKTKIMASGPITSWEIDGKVSENSVRLYFFGLQNHCRW